MQIEHYCLYSDSSSLLSLLMPRPLVLFFFFYKISLKSLVTTGTITGFAALKCSENKPYSSADFLLLSSSTALPTSASEMLMEARDSVLYSVSKSN